MISVTETVPPLKPVQQVRALHKRAPKKTGLESLAQSIFQDNPKLITNNQSVADKLKDLHFSIIIAVLAEAKITSIESLSQPVKEIIVFLSQFESPRDPLITQREKELESKADKLTTQMLNLCEKIQEKLGTDQNVSLAFILDKNLKPESRIKKQELIALLTERHLNEYLQLQKLHKATYKALATIELFRTVKTMLFLNPYSGLTVGMYNLCETIKKQTGRNEALPVILIPDTHLGTKIKTKKQTLTTLIKTKTPDEYRQLQLLHEKICELARQIPHFKIFKLLLASDPFRPRSFASGLHQDAVLDQLGRSALEPKTLGSGAVASKTEKNRKIRRM